MARKSSSFASFMSFCISSFQARSSLSLLEIPNQPISPEPVQSPLRSTYLTAILELDCLTLNEDRHTNNLAVLRNEETKEFRLCPIFDNGLSLLSDLNDYPLTDDLYTCIERVQAKPFDSDHVEQVTAAEQLYGRQLTFRISHGELRSELNLLSEAYSPDILQRAERVLLEQKRKHSWLF